MSFERVYRSSSQTPQTSWSTSQFAPRPFPVQEPKRPPTQEELENQAFQQNKFEATGLQLKEKYGTITPVEQERLGMLQAKMDSFWAQRMERAKAQPNLLEILIHNAQSTQANEQANESAAPVQPKLTIGQPNDQYEQEADRVAEQVISMAPPATPNIQRQAEEEQEEVQTKPLVETITPIVQRQEALEEDEPIQAKCESCEAEEQVQRSPNGVLQVQADLESRLSASKGGGSPLSDEVRSFMEPRFNSDFKDVRVHTGSDAIQMNRDLNAQAFTHKQDIYFGDGRMPGNDPLTAHELTHVVQQNPSVQARFSSSHEQPYSEITQQLSTQIGTLQRDCDPTVASCPPVPETNSSPGSSAADAQSAQSLEDAQQTYQTTRSQLLEQGTDCNPQSNVFTQYCRACETLTASGQAPSDEPQGVLLPGDQMLVVDESGQVQLLNGDNVVGIGEDLFPVLDDIADASQTGQVPSAAMGSSLEQVILWSDGRAVITPPVSGDLASLLLQGQPTNLDSAVGVGNLGKPWERVRDAGVHSLLTSGLYQLGSHPISRFNGVQLPTGSRIRFADVGRLMSGQMETRLITIFQPGTNKYYAWDAHLPVGNQPHQYWHVNQKGMSANLFGQSNHAAMTPAQIAQARNLKYIRVGGRALFVAGVLVDGYAFYNSAVQSSEQGTPRPVVAQAVRTVGGWGGAWAGAKLGCAGGALAGAETGPGLVLTCLAGGIIGGFAGYTGADWIADMISED